MGFLILVRCQQLLRLLRAAGWGLLLVLLVVTAGVWAPGLLRLSSVPPFWLSGLGLLLAGSVHLGRSDGSFIHQMPFPPWQTCLIDTALLLLPGSLLLVAIGNWPAALAFFAGLAVVVLPLGGLSGRWRKKARFKVLFLPPDLFELRSAVRGLPVGWLLAFLLQLGAGWHIAAFVGAVVLVLVLLGTVFEALEPKELLPRNRRALLRKWRRNALALHLFFSPAYVLALLWQTEFYWLILYAAVAIECLLALLFFYKYALWYPGREQLGSSVFTAIGLLLVVLPGGILVALPMAVWAGWKGLRRQQYFTYD
ncbi:MAG: hypothetical protein IT260_01835 [Saprospiraceae bacterium]|nr:hypothetical protein [Saprospiraceae bacterium]